MKIKHTMKAKKLSLRELARRKKQSGELSLIEAGAVLGAMALLALGIYLGVPFVRNMVQASSFKSEATMFHTGIQNATVNDADFSGESLTTLAQNHAFDSAGARLASDKSSVTGIFGGQVTSVPGTVTTTNDAIITSYPVPAAVCSMSVASLANTYTKITINGTVISAPGTTFNSSTAGNACSSAGQVATIQMYTTRS
ncbi:hypothetical protein [Paraburkholderia sp. WP4_3_2]|uniref:hypothetical protein n=1 Tax=Paraburkholderia sp. WP4_3_2 TaxID=2587162 RepID=UPI00160D90A0|nr:hypothetical protein [Paraburkholderia sp. WP4_3_2]MBB3261262.1 transcriptional regulator with XRE-family HTH domain [Paraburkholderia sp. WP4_3_2]